MNSVQFATAIHILTLLAVTDDNLSSSDIAGSINTNASLVRKSLSVLGRHGLVQTREGKGGGNMLARAPEKILLSEVYHAIISQHLLGKMNNPDPSCKIGKQINQNLTKLYDLADEALISRLAGITLADFCKKFD